MAAVVSGPAAIVSGRSPLATGSHSVNSGSLPPTAGHVVSGAGAAALPLQQRALRVIRCSPTSSLRLGTPCASANATGPGSFRLATPISSTPKVLWPGTPTPYPVPQSNVSFGVSQVAAVEQQPVGLTANGHGVTHPNSMMLQAFPYTSMQAPVPVMLPNGQIMMQGPPIMMPAMTVNSPGGTVYQGTQAGFMAVPGFVPQLATSHGSSPTRVAPAAPPAETQVPAPSQSAGSPRRVVVVQASSSSTSAAAAGGGTVGLTPAQQAAVASGQIPSVGSAIHDGTGKCSPCAWFWKPRGCQSESSCGYCHLCPEGELKNRKKAKIAAIKMGAIEPQHPKQGSPPQRANLKLNTLL